MRLIRIWPEGTKLDCMRYWRVTRVMTAQKGRRSWAIEKGRQSPGAPLANRFVARLSVGFTLVAAWISAAGATDQNDLAMFFMQTCISHLGDDTQLAAAATSRGGRRVQNPEPNPELGAESPSAEGETWVVDGAGGPLMLHFKTGSRGGRSFVLCLVRQGGDVFDRSVEILKRSLALRPVRVREEPFTKRLSFLVGGNPTLLDVSAGQGPLARFTLISAVKLLSDPK